MQWDTYLLTFTPSTNAVSEDSVSGFHWRWEREGGREAGREAGREGGREGGREREERVVNNRMRNYPLKSY